MLLIILALGPYLPRHVMSVVVVLVVMTLEEIPAREYNKLSFTVGVAEGRERGRSKWIAGFRHQWQVLELERRLCRFKI